MARPKYEFGDVTSLSAEALGRPGERTFRILANSNSASTIIWLEKEQLFQLALAIQPLLTVIPEQKDAHEKPHLDKEAPELTHLDFRVVELAVGYDERNAMLVIDAHGPEDHDPESPTVRVWASKELAKEFAEQAFQVCAAGRPLCPFCGGPADSTDHRCPRVNGQVDVADL